MKASELITQLQALIAERGDVSVGAPNADRDYISPIRAAKYDEELNAIVLDNDPFYSLYPDD